MTARTYLVTVAAVTVHTVMVDDSELPQGVSPDNAAVDIATRHPDAPECLGSVDRHRVIDCEQIGSYAGEDL